MTRMNVVYSSQPSALRYMAQAFRPSPGWNSAHGVPDISLSWHGFRIDAAGLDTLSGVTDCPGAALADRLSVLLPHVSGFRLLMVLLTHPAWPLPIWGALQVRNRLLLHRPFAVGERYELQTRPLAWRVLDKGLEIDLHSRLVQDQTCLWESVVSFYYRGRFGAVGEHGNSLGAPADAPALTEQDLIFWQGRISGGARWQFGRITGDYNGIHQWDAYARRLGFDAAFAHSQRLVAQALAHLPPLNSEAQELDLWIRGPVAYGSAATLRQRPEPAGDAITFGLWRAGDARAALLGNWRALPTT